MIFKNIYRSYQNYILDKIGDNECCNCECDSYDCGDCGNCGDRDCVDFCSCVCCDICSCGINIDFLLHSLTILFLLLFILSLLIDHNSIHSSYRMKSNQQML